ncbi:MAG: holin [Erysipelotrichia bacterium]|nr:holin [Erysipelotrichia bacterium]NCC54438.1 holin [Erysipelotrichia bacterium]
MEHLKLVNPELLMLIPVLNALGTILKKSRCNNDNIPLILGIVSIVLCAMHSYALQSPSSWFLFVYENISQGLLIAAASVYGHQIYCKSGKNKKQS